MRLSSGITVAALAVFTLFPDLQGWLPRPDAWDDVYAHEGRSVGPLMNPNDLAYAACALALLHIALLPTRRVRGLDRVLLGIVLASAATCVVESGSRSGFIGITEALAFLAASRRISLSTRAVIVTVGVVIFAAGMAYSAVFETRLSRAYQMGMREENVYTRVDAQALAVRTALAYPLGVGFTSFARISARTGDVPFTTSDSVYFDTLLGAGFLGFACFLALIARRGCALSRASAGTQREAVLKAGLLAFLFFGAATVVPISVFLSPLFFSLVGAAAFSDADGGE